MRVYEPLSNRNKITFPNPNILAKSNISTCYFLLIHIRKKNSEVDSSACLKVINLKNIFFSYEKNVVQSSTTYL